MGAYGGEGRYNGVLATGVPSDMGTVEYTLRCDKAGSALLGTRRAKK